MRSNANPAPIRDDKRRLLTSCAIAAGMAALAYGGPALAQVEGTGSFVTGGGVGSGIDNSVPNTTTVTTTTGQTIINWVPTDTATGTTVPINFLPFGETLNFVGPDTTPGGYTVLNRFVDGVGGSLSRQIALNGTVNSRTDVIGVPNRGGNIWFYNAGGILIGPQGVINVGSLVLTSNDIVTTGGLFGPSGEIRFRGTPGSTSAITVNGTILADDQRFNPAGSYVALVAPRVVQGGDVTVNGSAAYVAAEQVDIRTNNGLFDISVLVGAESGEVITHTGTTTGPADLESNAARSRIYMVTVAKNDAVSMLVSGQVGYDDAVVAQAQPDGAVILSAGYNVSGGDIVTGPINDLESNITVADIIFRSDTVARARGSFLGRSQLTLFSSAPPNEGNVFVEGNGLFIGDQSASLDIQLDQAGGASGNLTVQSRGPGGAEVNVNTGELNVGGNLIVDGIATFDANSGNSTAGLARLQVGGGGDVTVGGNVTVSANAEGGFDDVGNSGIGYGGNVSIEVGGGGSTLTAGNIDISANGTGGGVIFDPINGPFVEDFGADGVGGVATISVQNGGSITATNSITATANGQGQTGLFSSGNGIGGNASIDVVGESTSLQAPIVTASANGTGGGTFSSPPPFGTTFSAAGGSGIGGTASMTFNVDAAGGGNIGAARITATGSGGNAGGSEAASAGGATGGNASLAITNGTVTIGDLTVDAAAIGGSSTSPGGTTATSGDAFGGNASVSATATGDLDVTGTIAIGVSGSAGASENIGSARGGGANVNATAGGSIAVTGEILIDAGGSNRHNLVAQNAGTATGGNVSLGADGGSIVADSYTVNASAMVVNVAGDSGTAQGGTIAIDARNTGLIGVSSSGTGSRYDAGASSGISADGTDALGGIVNVTVNAGTINLGTLGAVTSFNASGISGGATLAGGPVPVGAGGNIQFRVEADGLNSSVLSFDGLNVSANGRTAVDIESAPSLPRDTAGTGSGGVTLFDIDGGTVTGGVINLSADGYGGGTGNNSATGQGGTTILTQTGGTVNVADVRVSADGFGGTALGTSGTGFGGTATINLFGGSITAADIIASASGEGGAGSTGNDDDPLNIIAGGNGGQGIGANASIVIDGAVTINASTIGAFANGQGGAGGDFQNASSATGDPGSPGFGGTGQGGNASVTVFNGDVTTSGLTADSSGFGGVGGSSLYLAGPMTGVGVGGSGGLGQGGLSMVDLIVPINATGTVASVSQGTGGLGGTHNVGGTGGDGFGGLAQAIVTNADGGTLAVTLDTRAQGGNGGQGLDGNGGNGGYALGGIARVAAEGPEASLTVVETNFLTTGTGGNGGNAGLATGAQPLFGTAGGFGGNGQGGTIEIAANAGGTVRLGFTSGNAVTLTSTGIGGNGGAGASNFGSTTLPGDDGILGTEDDVVFNHIGGDGGVSGAGIGGDVRLIANGGTITSNGENLTISVSGISGNGGEAGNGTGGTGSCCSISADVGGRVSLEAWADADGPGSIELGNTNISANGLFAGRISILTDSSITMAGLNAQALGFAFPTNNDTDEAPAGIFIGVINGTVRSNGAATLSTGSSIGVYAQGTGRLDVVGDAIIEAGDQIDLRHEFRGNNVEGPTITAANNLSLLAGTSISGAPGTRLAATENLNLINTSPNGSIGVDRLDAGADIAITSNGFVSVEHAEAVNDFTATVGSFRTGLNSIITGGDIDIAATGTVDLGNSSAGGFVFVDGQSVAFNTIDAGSFVSLRANGFGATDGVTGANITAGSGVSLSGGGVALSGTVETGDSLSVTATQRDAAIGLANAVGNISVSAAGNLTGVYRAGGNVNLNADGNIAAEADAAGGYVDSSTGFVSEGYVFADAEGDAALTNSSAATMIGIRSGGATSLTGASAGEDIFVLAGTTANLTGVTAGDDVAVEAAGGITIADAETTGTGPDGRSVIYATGSSSPVPFLQIQDSAADLSNITASAPTMVIGGAGVSAFDNLIATGGTIAASGPLSAGGNIVVNATGSVDLGNSTAGGFVQVIGESLAFNSVVAGDTVNLITNGTLTGAEGIRGGTIDAGDDITLSGNSIIIAGNVSGNGSFFAFGSGGPVSVNNADVDGSISIFAAGDLSGTYVAGGDVFLNSDANINASARANGGYVDRNGNATQGNLFAIAAGNATLTDSSAARMFGVNAGTAASIDGGTAGEDMLVIAGTTATLTDVTAGDDIGVRAAGNINAQGVRTTGAGADTHILDFSTSGSPTFTIGVGEGTQGINGADIVMASTAGAIDAATLSAGDDILLDAPNGIALNGATTLGLGTTGGDSSIRTQGGATTLANLASFDDIIVDSTATANFAAPATAGRNVVVNADTVTLAALTEAGGSPINTIDATGDITINAANAITGGSMIGDGVALTAGTTIDVGDINGGTVALDGATGVAAERIFSVNTTGLASADGDIQIGSLASSGEISASANAIRIDNGGNMIFTSLVTDVGDAVVNGGEVFVISGNVAGKAELTSTGERLGIDTLTAGSAELEASGGFMTLGNVAVTGSLDASALSSLLINGIVTGRNIALASESITIDSAARVGTAGVTDTLSVQNNNSANQTFVGGTGTPDGYHIDAAELARLYGTQIEIVAPAVQAAGGASVGSAAPPDVIVDSFTMTGGAAGSNLGANGALTIRTPGKMRVIGNVQLTGLTDANALNLFADDALEVILGQGSVRLLGANNAPGGQLNLASDDIIVATPAAITAVGAATTTDAINSRLGENDGILLDEGALFARGIRAEVAGGFYVQNSGAGTDFGQRRGLTFGAGGLDVVTAGPSRIVVNGVQIGANGQVTGVDVIPVLTVNGVRPIVGSYDRQSTLNGCFIASPAACTTVTFDFENNFPVQDVIEEEVKGDEEAGRDGNNLPQPLITMRDLDPLTGEPLLDDPVTGSGNDDLWTPPAQ